MFKLPTTLDEFVYKKLPGNYETLLQKFHVGKTVTELESYEAKRIYILNAIDNNLNFYVTPANDTSENPECFLVFLIHNVLEKI